MSTDKKVTNKKAADKLAVQKANETALKGYPKAKLLRAFAAMADLANEADGTNEKRAAAALGICQLAADFRAANDGATSESVIDGWRDHGKLVTMELAVKGNRFAELSEGKDGKAPTAKLTGYGNNVMSIAKGCIEFDVDPSQTDSDVDPSYREVRKAVEGLRAEKRRAANPDEALLADAKDACREAAKDLLDLMFSTGDVQNIDGLSTLLRETQADIQAQIDAAETIEADSDEATADDVAAVAA